MINHEIKKFNINDIFLDENNPRFEPTGSQQNAIDTMIEDQGDKLLNLAKDIRDNGLNPSQNIIIFKENNRYIDGDGNRRITVLKIINAPNLVTDEKFRQKIQLFNQNHFPKQVNCVVFNNREEAKHWVGINHGGELDGRGAIGWNAIQKNRFKGVESIGLQIIERYVADEEKGNYHKSTMDRFFTNAFIKKQLNIQIKNNIVSFDKIDSNKINKIITALNGIKVKEVYNAEDIRVFYQKLYPSSVQEPKKPQSSSVQEPKKPQSSSEQGPEKPQSSSKGRKATNARNSVIPNDLSWDINCQKTKNVFEELKNIPVEKYVNASAVLLRTFLELAVHEYLKEQNLEIDRREPLISCFEKAFQDMKDKKTLSKNELKPLQHIIKNPNHFANTNILNAYVHNRHMHPDSRSVKIAFDSLCVFFEKVYQK